MVIGEREALQPRAACPVGFEDGPHAAALISAISEPDAERDARGVGFLAHIELETRGASFEIGKDQILQQAIPCVLRLGVPLVSRTWESSGKERLGAI